MSGHNFSYKVYKKYVIDIIEHYEDTSFTRAFIYKKNSLNKDLLEVIDFPNNTEKTYILEKASEFVNALEKLYYSTKINDAKGYLK